MFRPQAALSNLQQRLAAAEDAVEAAKYALKAEKARSLAALHAAQAENVARVASLQDAVQRLSAQSGLHQVPLQISSQTDFSDQRLSPACPVSVQRSPAAGLSVSCCNSTGVGFRSIVCTCSREQLHECRMVATTLNGSVFVVPG